jgi:hypothetical protein
VLRVTHFLFEFGDKYAVRSHTTTMGIEPEGTFMRDHGGYRLSAIRAVPLPCGHMAGAESLGNGPARLDVLELAAHFACSAMAVSRSAMSRSRSAVADW